MLFYYRTVYNDKVYDRVNVVHDLNKFLISLAYEEIIFSQSWLNPNVQNLVTQLKFLDLFWDSYIICLQLQGFCIFWVDIVHFQFYPSMSHIDIHVYIKAAR